MLRYCRLFLTCPERTVCARLVVTWSSRVTLLCCMLSWCYVAHVTWAVRFWRTGLRSNKCESSVHTDARSCHAATCATSHCVRTPQSPAPPHNPQHLPWSLTDCSNPAATVTHAWLLPKQTTLQNLTPPLISDGSSSATPAAGAASTGGAVGLPAAGRRASNSSLLYLKRSSQADSPGCRVVPPPLLPPVLRRPAGVTSAAACLVAPGVDGLGMCCHSQGESTASGWL